MMVPCADTIEADARRVFEVVRDGGVLNAEGLRKDICNYLFLKDFLYQP